MIRTSVSMLLVCSLMTVAECMYHPQSGTAYAQDAWKAEFDEICGKTDDAGALTRSEIKSLIERCDTLRPRIEKLDESAKKVYLKRLQSCRDLFVFVLESPAGK